MNKRLIATAAILLTIFLSAALKPSQASAPLRALLQDTAYPIETPVEEPTGYDGPEAPTETSAYPGIQETPVSDQPTSTKTGASASATPTTGPSPTAGRNLFSTEDAEIQGARVTPRTSETAAPSRTPNHSPTPLPSLTPTPTPPFIFDRTWFAAGLFVPMVLLFAAWLVFRIKNSGEFKS